jgi:tetratricopeptide (TPR) repeat protein
MREQGSRLCVFALVWLLLSALGARAEIPAAAFDAANKLYEQGRFSDAASAYEKLLQSGQASTALYFNLGNAFFKAGQIGRAIAAYRQAEQLAPRDPDLRANLQFARNQVQSPTLSSTRWQRALGKLSLNEWTLLAAGAVWLWLLLLGLLQWRPALKPALRAYLLAAGVAAALLVACFASAFSENRFARTAIVAARDVVVRQGPMEESQSAFTVHDGAELRVLDQKDGWLQVTTDPRRIGWLRRNQVLAGPLF